MFEMSERNPGGIGLEKGVAAMERYIQQIILDQIEQQRQGQQRGEQQQGRTVVERTIVERRMVEETVERVIAKIVTEARVTGRKRA